MASDAAAGKRQLNMYEAFAMGLGSLLANTVTATYGRILMAHTQIIHRSNNSPRVSSCLCPMRNSIK